MRRYNGKNKNDEHYVWSVAAGELCQEVRRSVYKQLKAHHLSTKRLFIVSAWTLQEFVAVLSTGEQPDHHMRLIDEQRFMRTLIEGVLVKRKREKKQEKVPRDTVDVAN